MPSEIRNATYAKTSVDLLLPPASAGGRGTDGGEGFDSLLRALAPSQDFNNRQSTSDRPSAPAADANRESGYAASASGSEQRSSADRRDDVHRSQEPSQSSRDQDSSRAEAPSPGASAEQTATHDVQPNSDDNDAQSEVVSKDQATVSEPGDQPADDSEAAKEIDAAAMQVAALAAQVAPAANAPASEAEASAEVSADGTAEAKGEATATAAKPVAADVVLAANPQPAVDPKQFAVQAGTDAVSDSTAPDDASDAHSTEIVTELPNAEAVIAKDQDAAVEQESVEISQLKSTRTKTSESILHDVDPKQLGEVEKEAENTEAPQESGTESAQAEVATDSESILPAMQASDDSNRRGEKRDREEAAPTEIKEVSAGTVAESAPIEAMQAEPPPADSALQPAGEGPRNETRPAAQAPQTLLDPTTRPAGAPRLAAEVLAGGTRETSPARPVEIDSARFLTRVARAFTSAQQRGGEVQLRLSPPELGSLRVEVKVVEGVMTAKVETENAAAKAAVMEHLPQLRERLAEQGVRIERFDVDLMQQGSTGTPDRPADRQPEEAFAQRGAGGAARRVAQAEQATKGSAPSPVSTGGLNVIV